MATKERAGYLTKQGKTVKNWRKRWIVLKNNHLHYFKAKDDAQPLDSIPLNECSCSFALYCETKKRSCLKINTPRRTWYFSADTDEEIGQWMESLFLWGVPESREEEEVITPIVESTSALQNAATSVVQSSNSGGLDAFRDLCRTATLRGDAFTNSIQAITKYNSSVKYSPSPNFNDFLKDITVSSGSLRDNFVALITLAEDARDSPNDPELRRKLMTSASAITDKLTSFKKLILDETKGLRPQLRLILYHMPWTYWIIMQSTPTPAHLMLFGSTQNLDCEDFDACMPRVVYFVHQCFDITRLCPLFRITQTIFCHFHYCSTIFDPKDMASISRQDRPQGLHPMFLLPLLHLMPLILLMLLVVLQLLLCLSATTQEVPRNY